MQCFREEFEWEWAAVRLEAVLVDNHSQYSSGNKMDRGRKLKRWMDELTLRRVSTDGSRPEIGLWRQIIKHCRQ